MKNIKAIIVDDEEDGREALSIAIKDYCTAIDLVAICDSASSGLQAIESHKPDLVFLDIQMPHTSGFDMLQQIESINFNVIFVTAYDRYAIKAIKFSALDYLLKPIDIDELQAAVKRFETTSSEENDIKLQAVYNNLPDANAILKKIAVPTMESLLFLNTDDIIYCKADGQYTSIYLLGKRHILVSRTLGDFENFLTDARFCRVHHSFFININHVEEYVRGDGGYVKLIEGHHADVSRRKKEQFLKQLHRV